MKGNSTLQEGGVINKKIIYTALAVLVAAGVILGIWTRPDKKPSQPGGLPATTQNQQNSTSNQSQTNQPHKTYPVSVYFSKHPDSDNDPGKTFAVSRVSPDSGVAKFAIGQLLDGPSVAEADQGYFTMVRLKDGPNPNDFKITISSETAILTFLKPFDHLGVVADGQADSEIKATLKQFSTVKKVIILNTQGNCEFDLSGQNLCKQ